MQYYDNNDEILRRIVLLHMCLCLSLSSVVFSFTICQMILTQPRFLLAYSIIGFIGMPFEPTSRPSLGARPRRASLNDRLDRVRSRIASLRLPTSLELNRESGPELLQQNTVQREFPITEIDPKVATKLAVLEQLLSQIDPKFTSEIPIQYNLFCGFLLDYIKDPVFVGSEDKQHFFERSSVMRFWRQTGRLENIMTPGTQQTEVINAATEYCQKLDDAIYDARIRLDQKIGRCTPFVRR
jgi:hypothetical protein